MIQPGVSIGHLIRERRSSANLGNQGIRVECDGCNQGVELIGVTAGEAENPEVVLPKATNGITFRILIFYIGALVVIMALVPWTDLSPDTSPFVFVFEKMRVPAAATIINLVVITAATSSCNSGIFSTGRMLFSLAQRGQAPRALAQLSGHRVPSKGINVSAAVMLVAVALNYWVPEKAFVYVTSVSTIGTLWTWGIDPTREGTPSFGTKIRVLEDRLQEITAMGFGQRVGARNYNVPAIQKAPRPFLHLLTNAPKP